MRFLRIQSRIAMAALLAAVPHAMPSASGEDALPQIETVRERIGLRLGGRQSFRVSWTLLRMEPKGSKDEILRALQDKDVLAGTRTDPPADAAIRESGQILAAQGMKRLDAVADSWGSNRQLVLDRDRVVGIARDGMEMRCRTCNDPAGISSVAFIHDARSPAPYLLASDQLGEVFGVTDILAAFSSDVVKPNFLVLRRDLVDGMPAVVVGNPPSTWSPDAWSRRELYLDAAHDYAVLRSATLSPDGRVISDATYRYSDDPSLGWTPISLRVVVSMAPDAITNWSDITLTGVEYQPSYDPAAFTYSIPAGTRVFDKVRMTNYTVGEPSDGDRWIQAILNP